MVLLKDYFKTWWTIMLRPIYFYTLLKEESWKEKALTFELISAWTVGFFVSLAVFIIQYVPIGSTLIEGISGLKFIIILPVLIILALVFFLITFLIVGGMLALVFFAAFMGTGFLLHHIYGFLGGKGKLEQMFQFALYFSAITLTAMFIVIFAFLTKTGLLSLDLFKIGYNLVYYFSLLYVYGIIAVAGRKVYGVAKWKAFAGALIPVVILVFFGIMFNSVLLSKLRPWLT